MPKMAEPIVEKKLPKIAEPFVEKKVPKMAEQNSTNNLKIERG